MRMLLCAVAPRRECTVEYLERAVAGSMPGKLRLHNPDTYNDDDDHDADDDDLKHTI